MKNFYLYKGRILSVTDMNFFINQNLFVHIHIKMFAMCIIKQIDIVGEIPRVAL